MRPRRSRTAGVRILQTHKPLQLVASLTLGSLFVACGSPASPSPSSSAPTVSPTAVITTYPSPTYGPPPSASAVIAATPIPTPSAPLITGFGAFTAAWESAHQADGDFKPGSAYNPDPAFGTVGGHTATTYFAVDHASGSTIIDTYLKRLHEGTSIKSAKANAMAEFPADAQQTDFKILDTCALMVVKSTILGNQLAASGFGDPDGLAMVGLYTALPDGNQAYQASNIDEMSFGPNSQTTVSPDDRC